MYSGFWLTITANDHILDERFVTPASMAENAADMLATLQSTDPQDEFSLRVAWGTSNRRPRYTVEAQP